MKNIDLRCNSCGAPVDYRQHKCSFCTSPLNIIIDSNKNVMVEYKELWKNTSGYVDSSGNICDSLGNFINPTGNTIKIK